VVLEISVSQFAAGFFSSCIDLCQNLDIGGLRSVTELLCVHYCILTFRFLFYYIFYIFICELGVVT